MSQDLHSPTEHLDVLIVGAGLSGIGAACRLRDECPQKTFAVLESRESMGGTWDLFRYPGIRSDSDMFTLGYAFRPWQEAKAIADGPDIRTYIQETAREYGVDSAIRFNRRVAGAEWSTAESLWTVEVEHTDTGERESLTCNFLYACTGYYRYDEGYTPEFEGIESFRGEVIHPQHWPEDLDYSGKRVVVIGSGATAITLLPAMAEGAEHITMLQRSPGYVVAMPATDPLATLLLKLRLPHRIVWPIMRWKGALFTQASFAVARRWPKVVKWFIRRGLALNLPKDFPTDPHFRPKYDPWDQRICLAPDGDLFKVLRRGEATIVTDRITRFTEGGIALESGEELAADIVITATGLNLELLGGIDVKLDGEPLDIPGSIVYKGAMLSGVPNAAMAVGYTNASWTLKCDLVSEYVARILNHMDENGFRVATPVVPDPSVGTAPLIDLNSGYVQRVLDQVPKQGGRAPWRLYQNYPRDIAMMRHSALDDEGIEFSRGAMAEISTNGSGPKVATTAGA